MFRLSATELRKQFRRLGLKVDVEEVKAERIVVETVEGKRLVLEEPQTTLLVKLPGKTFMLQVVASGLTEEAEAAETGIEVSEEDVRLVAEQAGVSMEEARRALEETGGDIAAAILLLEERKKA